MAQASSLKPRSSSTVRINVSGTRYAVVRQVAELLSMTVIEDEDDDECDVYWIDSAVPLEKYLQLKPYQLLNHFAGMGEICRKDSLARNIQKIKRIRKEEYNILPRTWVLPSEYGVLSHFMKDLKRRRRVKTFIVKPPNGAMGNGISLAQSIEQITQGENLIVQEYIEKPLLLDGFKFDLRVYVLVTSCDPLRIFIFKDGLVRLSTQAYVPPTNDNLDQYFMHLTNYSINKHSDTYDKDEDFDKGSKRSLQFFNQWLMRNGYNVIELWAKIHDVIVKTLIVAQPHIQHSYQACRPSMGPHDKCQCFEVLGFDVLVDENVRPWLIEVNRSPSFGIDSQLDVQIKTGVISDALRLMNIKPSDRVKKLSSQRMASRRRLLQPTSSRGSRQALDIIGDQEDAILMRERKREEVKTRLMEIRKNKELERHEEEYMGDYQRIYPSTDPHRQLVYESLLNDSASVSFAGKNQHRHQSYIKGLERMREKELLELLSQYETEERFGCLPTNSHLLFESIPSQSSSFASVQPLSFYESSPMEAGLKAMAAREHEEEQTQRTMLALNSLLPFYPGKSGDEVKRILEEIQSNWSNHQPEVRSFWLISLDSTKRKQLLTPIKECVRNLIVTYWRTSMIESIRLNKVFIRLFNFLLSNHGQGLWSTMPEGTGEHWEKLFKKKTDVLSISEIHCCRKVVELCQAKVIVAYYCYDFQKSTESKRKLYQVTTKRKSDLPLRPLTMHSTQKRSIVHLYGRGKSRSVPSVMITTSNSLPKIQS